MDLEMLQACLIVGIGSVLLTCIIASLYAIGSLVLGIGVKDDDQGE